VKRVNAVKTEVAKTVLDYRDYRFGTEEAQILNYLKASNKKLGLLINFGNPKKLEWKRFVY